MGGPLDAITTVFYARAYPALNFVVYMTIRMTFRGDTMKPPDYRSDCRYTESSCAAVFCSLGAHSRSASIIASNSMQAESS